METTIYTRTDLALLCTNWGAGPRLNHAPPCISINWNLTSPSFAFLPFALLIPTPFSLFYFLSICKQTDVGKCFTSLTKKQSLLKNQELLSCILLIVRSLLHSKHTIVARLTGRIATYQNSLRHTCINRSGLLLCMHSRTITVVQLNILVKLPCMHSKGEHQL